MPPWRNNSNDFKGEIEKRGKKMVRNGSVNLNAVQNLVQEIGFVKISSMFAENVIEFDNID